MCIYWGAELIYTLKLGEIMLRELVTEEELISILNERIYDHKEYQKFKAMSLSPLPANADKDGCNWDEVIFRRAEDCDPYCKELFNKMVAEAKLKYNIEV